MIKSIDEKAAELFIFCKFWSGRFQKSQFFSCQSAPQYKLRIYLSLSISTITDA
jgi:hypothetical protein